MLVEQEQKIVRCLKVAKTQGGGQSLGVLARKVDEWKHDVSKYLQKLKRQGKVTYFHSTCVWFWNEEVSINEFLKL